MKQNRNIYDLLNEVDMDLDIYSNVGELSEIEVKRIGKSITTKKLKNRRKHFGVAVALLLALGLLNTSFMDNIGVYAEAMAYNIASLLGIEKDLSSYSTVVNSSVTKENLTITLNEVIMDNNNLVVSSTLSSKEKLGEDTVLLSVVYVNGKLVHGSSDGMCKFLDDYTYQSVMTHHIPESSYEGDLDIKVVFADPLILGKEIDERWVFEFKTNGDELTIDTNSIDLDYCFKLENGEEITLNEYTSNAIGQRIYGYGNAAFYDIVLRGSDDLGNQVAFGLNTYEDKKCTFRYENIHGNLSPNARSINLIPYSVKYPETSGRMSNDFKRVGEEFTIKLRD